MNVGELKSLLENYKNEQYIQVAMEDSKNSKIRYQMIIQDVYSSAGWHTDPCNPDEHLVRILIHQENKIISTKLMTKEEIEMERRLAELLPQIRKKMSYYDYYLKHGVYPDE